MKFLAGFGLDKIKRGITVSGPTRGTGRNDFNVRGNLTTDPDKGNQSEFN